MAGRAAVAATSAGRSDSSVAIGPSPGCSSLSGAVSGGLPEIAMLAHPPPSAPVFGHRLGGSFSTGPGLQEAAHLRLDLGAAQAVDGASGKGGVAEYRHLLPEIGRAHVRTPVTNAHLV